MKDETASFIIGVETIVKLLNGLISTFFVPQGIGRTKERTRSRDAGSGEQSEHTHLAIKFILL